MDETIPAHRVVNRIGLLSGKQHFSGTTLMEELLENEGVEINNNQVAYFKDHFWDPADFLKPGDF